MVKWQDRFSPGALEQQINIFSSPEPNLIRSSNTYRQCTLNKYTKCITTTILHDRHKFEVEVMSGN